MNRTICQSNGYDLHFTKADEDIFRSYKEAEKELILATYKKLRDRNGIFASNQNKYVEGINSFNQFDSILMEQKLATKEFLNNE